MFMKIHFIITFIIAHHLIIIIKLHYYITMPTLKLFNILNKINSNIKPTEV